MNNTDKVKVSVCYAVSVQQQDQVALEMPVGSTLKQAITLSGLLNKHAEIDLNKYAVGVFGKIIDCDYVLHNNDRVEIYKPLIADPMQARRKRALNN